MKSPNLSEIIIFYPIFPRGEGLALIDDPASSVILEFEHNRNIVIDIVIIKKFGTTYLVFRFVKM